MRRDGEDKWRNFANFPHKSAKTAYVLTYLCRCIRLVSYNLPTHNCVYESSLFTDMSDCSALTF
jgi:hypothetical protein